MSFIPTNKILSQVTGSVSTTDNMATTVVQIPTSTNTGTLIAVEVIGTRTGGNAGASNDMIVVRLLSEYKNVDDTVTLFGTPEKYSNKDNDNCDVNLVISGANINVRVTGDTNNNYDWSAKATFFALAMGTVSVPTPFSAGYATPTVAAPSSTITFGSPSNGDTIIFTGFPTNGDFTFTKDDSTDFNTTFSTISELSDLISNKDDIAATDNGSEVTITVYTLGRNMNSATITGTGSYASLNITFSGGVSGSLTATDPMSLRMGDTDSFIVGFWVQLESYPAGLLIKKDDGWSNGDNFLLGADNSGNINTHTRVAAAGGQTFGGGNIPLSTPTFVTYWKNVADTSLNIAVNGGSPASFTYGGVSSFSGGAGDFVLGTDGPVGGVFGNYLDGRIDEVFVCKNPADMSAAIALINSTIYNSGTGARYSDLSGTDKTTLGLISWWTLDENSGTRGDSQDSINLTPNADVSQAAPIVPTAPPPFSAATSPDSANFLLATDPTDLRADSTDTMIFGYWVNVNNANNNGIAWKTDPNPSGYNYYLSTEGGGHPELLFVVAPGGSSIQVDSSTVLTTGTDHFILCWIDPATTTVNIQVDGGSVDSADYSGIAEAYTAGAGDFYVCKSADNNLLLDGKIDDFFVCKNPADLATAISTIQSSIYNDGTGKRYNAVTGTEKTDIGLIAWWGMDEETNTTRIDLHGNNDLANNGTVSQAPPIIPVPFNPTRISGLTGWFRGSSIGVSDGSNVATWHDESGNDNDANQATSINQPVFRATGGVNSLPCLEFNMATDNQYLTIAGIAPTFAGSPSTFTFFIVSALTDVALDNFNYTILSATRNTSNTVHEQFTVSDTPEYVYRESDDAPGGHGGAIADGNNVVADTFEIFTVQTTTTSATLYRGGVSSGSFAGRDGGGGRVYSPNQVSIGADRRFGVQDGANAKISEIIIYDSPLSSTDLNRVGNYLADKYGLSWTNI